MHDDSTLFRGEETSPRASAVDDCSRWLSRRVRRVFGTSSHRSLSLVTLAGVDLMIRLIR